LFQVLLPANTFPVLPGGNQNFSVSISNTSPSALVVPPNAVPVNAGPSAASQLIMTSSTSTAVSSQPAQALSSKSELTSSKVLTEVASKIKEKQANTNASSSAAAVSIQQRRNSAASDGAPSSERAQNSVDSADKERADQIIQSAMSHLKSAADVCSSVSESSLKNNTDSKNDSVESSAYTSDDVASISSGAKCANKIENCDNLLNKTENGVLGDAMDTETVENCVGSKAADISSIDDKTASTDVRKGGRRRGTRSINFTKCSMHRLFGGFDCMMHIFKYLNPKELLT
jgi:hypothetical protein